jgi:hypothetical protein
VPLSKLDDGFRHGLVLTQPLIAAAVLLPQRRPVSSWHFNVSIVLRRDSTLLRGSWSVETPSRIYSRLVVGASKGPNTRRTQVHNLEYSLSRRVRS